MLILMSGLGRADLRGLGLERVKSGGDERLRAGPASTSQRPFRWALTALASERPVSVALLLRLICAGDVVLRHARRVAGVLRL